MDGFQAGGAGYRWRLTWGRKSFYANGAKCIAEGHGFVYNELREVWFEDLPSMKNNRNRHSTA
ncbi:hypothetical protein ASG89_14595 [Paenibacillus sp. Soil766]|nr:hypothetical protein ASG89_14595 [Paenibacillus sp. Soil766]